MIRNHLKVALRNLSRNPFNSTINLMGLVTGITFSLLLALVIRDDLQKDRYHEGGEHIYRAYFNGLDDFGNITFTQGHAPFVLYSTLQEFDEVDEAVFFDEAGEFMVERGEEVFREQAYWGSTSLFDAFSFPLLEGSVAEAESNPSTIFISEALAERLIGKHWRGNIIGETVTLEEDYNMTVAGVFADTDHRSSLQFDLIVNVQAAVQWRGPESGWVTHWGSKGATVFAKLLPGVDPRGIEDQVNDIYKDMPGTDAGGEYFTLFPFERNYLWTEFEAGKPSGGRIQYLRIFTGAALFLLLIACINFINIATAQASRRAKEVGVRKTVGAGRSNLVLQFMAETGLLLFIAVVVSFCGVGYLLPAVNSLTGKELVIPYAEPVFWVGVSVLWGGLTILAGLYPSFVLSHFRPARVLKSRVTGRYGHANIRRGLVVFQFVLSALLIISAIVVNQQIRFLQNENLGLNRNNVLHFNLPGPYADRFDIIKEQLRIGVPGVKVSRVSQEPTNLGWIGVGYEWEGRTPDDGSYFYLLMTDYWFDDISQIQMKEGRFFDENIASDSLGLVINEKALDYIQLDDPVGKIIRYEDAAYKILGVVEDFNFRALHHEIEPMMIFLGPEYANTVMVQPRPESTAQTIALLKNTWNEAIPNYPFEYEFLDETYAEMYETEMIIGEISWYLAAIAIVISCLGLLGLVTFMAIQKTKEIGIRKVLGASVLGIISLLSRDFIRLIFWGLLIAVPLAWYGMDQWLQNYAYRTEVKWWTFALAGAILFTIGLTTVGIQSIKAALANPVKSLRNE